MKKFYVVGKNASKSLSPTIFNYWFKKYKINARYGFLELSETNFDKKIKLVIKNKETQGLNITIPFKQKILKHLDSLNKHAKLINAVNCVTVGSKIEGTNTDWEGYYKTLPKIKNLKRKNVIIVGYGGAALAIHYVLKIKGFKNILIFNRSRKKIRFTTKTIFTKDLRTLNDHLNKAEIIINTTPTNPINKKNLKNIDTNVILSDIVYSPKETSFLKPFAKNKKIYGMSMLTQQAALCFRLWFGFKPSIDQKLIDILDKKKL